MPRTISEAVEAEKDKDFNRPFELYQLFLPEETLYLAMFPYDVEFYDEGGAEQTYSAAALSRRPIKHTSDLEVDRMRIQIDNVSREWSAYAGATELQDTKIVVWKVFLDRQPSSNNTWSDVFDENDAWNDVFDENEVWLSIFGIDIYEYVVIGNYEDHIPLFTGYVDSFTMSEKSISFEVTSKLNTLDKRLPGRVYQLQCPWVFGDAATCGVSVPTQTGTIADIKDAGMTLVLDSITDEHWLFGAIIINGTFRTIDGVDVGDDEIELNFPVPTDIEVGDDYELEAGCSKVKDDSNHGCDYWDNREFFGGFPEMPKIRNTRG